MSRGVRGFSANPRPEPQAEAAREAPTLNLEELEEETFEERCGDDSDVLMMLFVFFFWMLSVSFCVKLCYRSCWLNSLELVGRSHGRSSLLE